MRGAGNVEGEGQRHRREFVQLGQYIFAGGGFVSGLLQRRVAGYFDTEAALKPLHHLWSLGIEEQFYIAIAWIFTDREPGRPDYTFR